MAFCYVCQAGFDRPHDCDDEGKCPRCGQPGNTKPRGWVPTEKEWLMEQPGTMTYCHNCERYFSAHYEPDGALRCPHCGLSDDDLVEEQNKKHEEKFTYRLGDRVVTDEGPGAVCQRHHGDVAGTAPWVGEEVRVKLDGGGYTYWTKADLVRPEMEKEMSKESETECPWKVGEQVEIVGGDDLVADPIGVIRELRYHPIHPKHTNSTKEWQANVELQSGIAVGKLTGFIPVTLLRSVENALLMKVVEVTEPSREMFGGRKVDIPKPVVMKAKTVSGTPTRCPTTRDGEGRCYLASGHAGPCRVTNKGTYWDELELENKAHQLLEDTAKEYIEPEPKTPETLLKTVAELEEISEWMKHGTLGSIKMHELRHKIIKAALAITGCSATWEFEREYRPGMALPIEAPMPGSNSSEMLGIRRELESIAYSVHNKLQPSHSKYIDADDEVVERLKNLVVVINSLQHRWLEDEESISALIRENSFLAANPGPQHKLVVFGPADPSAELAEHMKRAGIKPESEMVDTLNELAKDGWRVVYRHCNPSASLEIAQWRIMLEK